MVAMTVYAPALRLVVEVAEQGANSERIEGLHDLSRTVGLELIGFLRTYDLTRAQWAGESDPSPIVAVSTALGESIALLASVVDQETARRVPVASLGRIDELFDRNAKTFMHRYAAAVPERGEASSNAD
jgi:hypothetical protein